MKIKEHSLEKTGKSIFYEKSVYIDEYNHGGISNDQVDTDMWRNVFIPLLIII